MFLVSYTALNKTETVISHHRTGNYSFHAFLFNKHMNSECPVAHQDSNKKNKHRAISLPEEMSLFFFFLFRSQMQDLWCVLHVWEPGEDGQGVQDRLWAAG